MKHLFRCAVAGLLLLLPLQQTVHAEPLPFNKEPISLELRDTTVPAFLSSFFAEYGISVQMSEAVAELAGTLNGPRQGLPADVFASVSRAMDLVAYYDGTQVYVYRTYEVGEQYFQMSQRYKTGFVQAYKAQKLGDANNTIDHGTRELVFARGTPRFLEQVDNLARAIGKTSSTQTPTFQHFPLKYAWASDTTMSVGTRQVTVPGVASLLQQAISGSASRSQPLAIGSTGARFPEGLRGQGLAALRDGSAEPQVTSVGSRPGFGPQMIVADPYNNAVIVHDMPDKMWSYKKMIQQLDKEPMLVELAATIIDINKDNLDAIGLNFRLGDDESELVFGSNTTKRDFLPASENELVQLLPGLGGLTAGAVVGDATRFAARLNLLAEKQKLSIVSRPQVVTLNDVEAVIENSEEVFLPVAGQEEVDLFNVLAGTFLRVTPHVIKEQDDYRIRMFITIEDGSLELRTSTAQGAEIPVVRRNAVSTQAMIQLGQSLLLGGMVRDTETETVREIPGLRNVPVVKHLFKDRSKQRARLERLFLITPRLVQANKVVGSPLANTLSQSGGK